MGKVVDEIKPQKIGADGVVPYLKGKGARKMIKAALSEQLFVNFYSDFLFILPQNRKKFKTCTFSGAEVRNIAEVFFYE